MKTRSFSSNLADSDMLTSVLSSDDRTSRARGRGRKSLLIGHLLVLAGIGYYGSVAWHDPNAETSVPGGAMLLLAVFLWSACSWRVATSQLFHPYVLFLLSALFFTGGQLILEIWGLNEYGLLLGRYSNASLVRAIVLVLVGFWSFHSGALLVALRMSRGSSHSIRPAPTDSRLASTREIGLFLVAIAIVPFCVEMGAMIRLRMDAEYIALYQQQAVVGVENWRVVLSGLLMPGAFFIVAGHGGRKWLLLISLVCVAGLSTCWFLIGERSHAIMPVIAAAWLWHSRIKRVPGWLLVAAGIFLLGVVFPLFSVIRNDPLSERSSITSVKDAFSEIDKPLVSTLTEMGASLRPVVDTIALVPSSRPYHLGVGYVHALLNIFPNFIPFLHFPLEYGVPEMWYVETVDPATADLGGAWGFNFIAEAYLEFGWLGAPVALALLGAFIGGFSLWGSESLHPGRAAAVAAWWVIVLHFPRGNLESYTRQLVWFSLVPYLMIRFLELRRRKDRLW